MLVTRYAFAQDFPAMKRLWKDRFGDSDKFIRWFFQNRIASGFSVCTEQDGILCNMMHAYPVSYSVRGRLYPSVLLSGFATKKEYEGQGCLRRSFTFLLQEMRARGYIYAPLTPVALPYYYAFGFYASADIACLTAEKIPRLKSGGASVATVDLAKDASLLFSCYQAFQMRYSGILWRSLADFTLKCHDYLADGARCLALFQDQAVLSYAIFYEYDGLLSIEEVVTTAPSQEQPLLDALFALYPGCRVKLKLPPDSAYAPSFLKKEVVPKSACGLLNVPAALRLAGQALPYTVQVTDPVIPENNQSFYFNGEISNEAPQLIIDAGHLQQLLSGYASLPTLLTDGFADCPDPNIKRALTASFPKEQCFIIDEY